MLAKCPTCQKGKLREVEMGKYVPALRNYVLERTSYCTSCYTKRMTAQQQAWNKQQYIAARGL